MTDPCTDSSNEQYQLYWFDYFVSIGYIDSSSALNIYAPYGKCTQSFLWITYLINIVHFFILSSGILYLLNRHRNQSGFWWPFITWISSVGFLIASIVLFVLLSWYTTLFTILIIAFQLAALIILWMSIFIVILVAFAMEHRYQRCLLFFIIILLLIQIGCFTGQTLITLHCAFNLKFSTISLDYAYLSAIIAAVGTIVSTLLLDHIFIWCRQGSVSPRVHPAAIAPQGESESRSTSPVDSVILEDFHRQPEASLHYVYNHSGGTRRFRIQPTKRQANDSKLNILQLRKISGTQSVHSSTTTSEA